MVFSRSIVVFGGSLCFLSLISTSAFSPKIFSSSRLALKQQSGKLLLEIPVLLKAHQKYEVLRRGFPKRREGGGTRLSFLRCLVDRSHLKKKH